MDGYVAGQLLTALLGFLAGVGATVLWYRIRGYEVQVRKDQACGP